VRTKNLSEHRKGEEEDALRSSEGGELKVLSTVQIHRGHIGKKKGYTEPKVKSKMINIRQRGGESNLLNRVVAVE